MADSHIARNELRAAFTDHKQANMELEATSRAVEQGRALLVEKESEVARLNALDKRAAVHIADQLLSAACSEISDLITDVGSDAGARTAADRQFALAAATLHELQVNWANAQRKVALSLEALKKAIVQVMSKGGDLLADELKDQKARTFLLQSTLLGLGMFRAGPDQVFPLSANVREALNMQDAQFAPGQDPIKVAQSAWEQQFKQLLEDPDADLELLLPTKTFH
jgi:hypothetical protein